ncbi:hypothetical protein GLV98_08185 [Halobacillus litoralis]|uniref:Uncharacterized protein n=1 Tax=Halobacillus litoralis TaxID=45668 RepID=A0A845ECM2_9BACI|nr:hypothetical protein [Halobacillus litoralis]MYL49461.1 hypothetical protein [Halobacillus litoralis]
MSHIQFRNLSVDQITDASGIFSGTNLQSGFKAVEQRWEGNGKIIGHKNTLQHNKHLIIKRPSKRV